MTWTKFFPAVIVLAPAWVAADDRFASLVIEATGIPPGIYGDPRAALGGPATWIRDTSPNGGPDQRLPVSLIYPAWNVDESGEPVVVTVPFGGVLTVAFRLPVHDAPGNPFGFDFIVFGNALLGASQPLTFQSNAAAIALLGGPDLIEPMQVSVSPDLLRWYTYPLSSTTGADGLWGTQALAWDRALQRWGAPLSPNLPVPPTVTRASLAGRSLADAIDRFAGSAGGTAFDLRPSGFRWIRYIRITGSGGEVDAVARVFRPIASAPTTAPRPRP